MSEISQDIFALHRAAAKAKYTGDEDDFHRLVSPESIVGLTTLLIRSDSQMRKQYRRIKELERDLQYSVPLRIHREALDRLATEKRPEGRSLCSEDFPLLS